MKLSQRVLNLAESATLAVASTAARMRAEGVDVIGFGAGEPDFDTPEHIKQAAIAAISSGQTKYPKPASGIPDAKRAVCAKFALENGLEYSSEQVIVTAGAKMAIQLAMQALIDPGDEVVIPAPYWVSYPEITKLVGGVPVFVAGREDRDYKLLPEDIKPVLSDRTKLVILTSPSNPSGVTYTADELRSLADVLAERDLIVLSDELYDRLVFDGHQATSYASISDKAFAQTITINAASKTYAMTGWRVGYAAGPVDIIKAMSKFQTQSTSGAVTFNQHALAAALTGDQSVVEEMRLAYQKRGRFMYERLVSLSGIRCPRPSGAFYCFPNVSSAYARLGVSGSAQFADRLLQDAKVAVVPGIAFGLDAHVRMSFAVSMEQIEEGLSRLSAFLSD